jgi:hypothetical protein
MATRTSSSKSSGSSRTRRAKAGGTTKTAASSKKVKQERPAIGEEKPSPSGLRQDIRVDQVTVRTDDDVMYGHFCDVVKGEHQGAYGVYTTTLTVDDDGYPLTVIVETRDDRTVSLQVNYADIRPARAGGRR